MTDSVHAELEAQLIGLREDVECLTAQARRDAARIAQLEQALQLVRDLMHDLPAHDNVTLVAIRLRAHCANFAGDVIADALADSPLEGDAIDGQ